MNADPSGQLPSDHNPYETTHWSLILAAGDAGHPQSEQALETLLRTYWSAVYAFVRRGAKSDHDAEDLTQAFFVHFLENNIASVADPQKGRFRFFLRRSLSNFLKNQWVQQQTLKRGGGVKRISLEPRMLIDEISDATQLTAEEAFDRQWAVALLGRVLLLLREEFEKRGIVDTFDRLKDSIVPNNSHKNYQELATELDSSEGAVKALIFRMRRRFRVLLEIEVSQTVTNAHDVEEEIQLLFDAFSRS